MADTTTCATCGGDGYIGTDLCSACFGAGVEPPISMYAWRKFVNKRIVDIEDKCNDILDKCNDIFEQVSP